MEEDNTQKDASVSQRNVIQYLPQISVLNAVPRAPDSQSSEPWFKSSSCRVEHQAGSLFQFTQLCELVSSCK